MAEEPQEEQKGYEVKDKRRVNPDGTLKEEALKEESQNTQSQETASEAKAQGEIPEPPPANIYVLLQVIIGLLAEQAWQLMGIRLAPGQKEPIKDMAQAKIAIDTMTYIVDKIQTHISEEERHAVRSLLSDLQINFVRQS